MLPTAITTLATISYKVCLLETTFLPSRTNHLINRQCYEDARQCDVVMERKGFIDFNTRLFAENSGKADRIVAQESNPRIISTKLIAHFDLTKEGEDVVSQTKRRKWQDYFRRMILTNYGSRCSLTGIDIPQLLIASHIKPWAVSDSVERIDPNNGFILSPLYDKLFDRGYITFSNDKRVSISNWLSRQVKERIGIKDNQFFQFLPINDARARYLEYHRATVFKG